MTLADVVARRNRRPSVQRHETACDVSDRNEARVGEFQRDECLQVFSLRKKGPTGSYIMPPPVTNVALTGLAGGEHMKLPGGDSKPSWTTAEQARQPGKPVSADNPLSG